MGSVENCVTVIAKVSMKCSTKVNEIERGTSYNRIKRDSASIDDSEGFS